MTYQYNQRKRQPNRRAMLAMLLAFACAAVFLPGFAIAQDLTLPKDSVILIKQKILALAQSYSGRGDPDFSKQKSFEPLIAELLALQPQPSVRDRAKLLAGAWYQVWGPYNYRSSERSVDPEIGVNEIYQVVFADGFYYNVTPLLSKTGGKPERIALLRGEYQFDPVQKDVLNVKFTRYPGLSSRPAAPVKLYELPKLVELGDLTPDINIVPTLVVKFFFGGGALKEIYTDSDLRIFYGSSNKQFEKAALYVMTRIPQ
jgi:hypothetical protein